MMFFFFFSFFSFFVSLLSLFFFFFLLDLLFFFFLSLVWLALFLFHTNSNNKKTKKITRGPPALSLPHFFTCLLLLFVPRSSAYLSSAMPLEKAASSKTGMAPSATGEFGKAANLLGGGEVRLGIVSPNFSSAAVISLEREKKKRNLMEQRAPASFAFCSIFTCDCLHVVVRLRLV